MLRNLKEELDFVGAKMMLPWFNKTLADNYHFIRMVKEVLEERSEIGLRNVLFSIPPLCEYVASLKGQTLNRSNGNAEWTKLFEENTQLIARLAMKYGTQGNIPQRAAILLDYLRVSNLVSNGAASVFELGCSAGLLGTALCSAEKLFIYNKGALARKYFWLTRMPKVRASHNFTYRGYDRTLPSRKLAPYYVWDTRQRVKVANFAKDFPLKGELCEESFEQALCDVQDVVPMERVIILTSFVLCQVRYPERLMREIMNLVYTRGNVHWLDLSRNNGLDCMFQQHKVTELLPNHIYLSHNGHPVAKVINGGDDCPDWEYL